MDLEILNDIQTICTESNRNLRFQTLQIIPINRHYYKYYEKKIIETEITESNENTEKTRIHIFRHERERGNRAVMVKRLEVIIVLTTVWCRQLCFRSPSTARY